MMFPHPKTLSWPVRVALIMMVGIAIGAWWPRADVMLVLAGIAAVMMFIMQYRQHYRIAHACALIGLLAVSSAWFTVREYHTVAHDLSRYVMPSPTNHTNTYDNDNDNNDDDDDVPDDDPARLVQITGLVATPVRLTQPHHGPFAKFSYQNVATFFTLQAQTIDIGHGPQPVAGNALVRINHADPTLKLGMHISATGWLTATQAPYNPGDRDYRQVMRQRGIAARLTLPTSGNWHELSTPDTSNAQQQLAPHSYRHVIPNAWQTGRQSLANAAQHSLAIGMRDDTQRLAFLETILLGQGAGTLGDLRDDFQRTGLAHLLSISGAHLGILMGIAWIVCRLFIPYPSRAAMIVMALLVLYLLIVPARLPIVRAGIMGGLFCLAGMTGRRTRPLDIMAIACIIVLVWRPMDLFSAGFQLSFGVVAGLLIWTKSLTKRLIPTAFVELEQASHASSHHPTPHHPTLLIGIWKKSAGYVAGGIVAFAVAAPMVAYHFQMIAPLSIILTLLALPAVTATLGLGYLKILIGFAWPSLSLLLAGPLGWTADITTSLVRSASDWPGSTITLAHAPSALWTWAALMLVAAWLSGWLAERRITLAVLTVTLLGWMIVSSSPRDARWLTYADKPAIQITMIAVGDGSCYLVRTGPDGNQPGQTILFDCGSYQLLNIGTESIVPTLRKLGVKHIDQIFLSHADLDHFGASLDILDHLTVGRVMMSAFMLAEARAEPDSAMRVLVDAIELHGTPIETVHAGWQQNWGTAKAAILWPTPTWESRRANDTSLVLAVHTDNRRLLLNGDIEQRATEALLTMASTDNLMREAMDADVTDLPHHGAFIPASPAWLDVVTPKICLQSNAAWRLKRDPWQAPLQSRNIQRYSTARHGMVDIRIMPDGTMLTSTYRLNNN